MSSYTYLEAYDHLLATFQNTWTDAGTGWASVLTEEPRVEWPNLDGRRTDSVPATPEDGDGPWVRVYVRHFDSDQATLGEQGCRIFTRTGMIGVDIFAPLNTGLKLPYQLGIVSKRAFEGKRGHGDGSGIIFRSVRLRERDNYQKRWAHVSVQADFEYDEVL